MDRLKGVVITLVHRHDHIGIGAQLLDIDTSAEATTLRPDDDDMHFLVFTKIGNFCSN